jgi:hypothetical protein
MDLFKIKEKLKDLIVEIENLCTKLKSHKNLITKFDFSLDKQSIGDEE